MKQAKLLFPLSLVLVLFCGLCHESAIDLFVGRIKQQTAKRKPYFCCCQTNLYGIHNSSELPQMLWIFPFSPKTKEIPQIILVSLFVCWVQWSVFFYYYYSFCCNSILFFLIIIFAVIVLHCIEHGTYERTNEANRNCCSFFSSFAHEMETHIKPVRILFCWKFDKWFINRMQTWKWF